MIFTISSVTAVAMADRLSDRLPLMVTLTDSAMSQAPVQLDLTSGHRPSWM